MVGVGVVAALSRVAGEMGHGLAVVVGAGDLHLIHPDCDDAAFGVKQRHGDHVVEGVDLDFLVVLARSDAAGVGSAQANALGGDAGQRDAVVKGLADGGKDVAMAVLEAHGGGAGDVGQVGLVRIRERVELCNILLVGGVGLQRAAVDVGGVLRKPRVHFVHRHADEDLLICVHLALPGGGIELVAFATLALGLPGSDLGEEVLLGVFGYAVHLLVMVGIHVVTRLARQTAQVGHGFAVIVGGGDFQLVNIQIEDLAFAVKERGGIDFIEGVDLHVLVVLAGADTARVDHAQAQVRVGGLDGLGRVLFNGFDGHAQRAGHSVQDGLAGIGRAGDDIHVDAASLDDLRRELLKRQGTNALGFLLARGLDGNNLAVLHGHGDLHFSAETIGGAREYLSLRYGPHQHKYNDQYGNPLLHDQTLQTSYRMNPRSVASDRPLRLAPHTIIMRHKYECIIK